MDTDRPIATGLHPALPVAFSPREVNALARVIAERERLRTQDLPRCRREIRLQLRLGGMAGIVPEDSAEPRVTPTRHRRARRAAPRARADTAPRVTANAVDAA